MHWTDRRMDSSNDWFLMDSSWYSHSRHSCVRSCTYVMFTFHVYSQIVQLWPVFWFKLLEGHNLIYTNMLFLSVNRQYQACIITPNHQWYNYQFPCGLSAPIGAPWCGGWWWVKHPFILHLFIFLQTLICGVYLVVSVTKEKITWPRAKIFVRYDIVRRWNL